MSSSNNNNNVQSSSRSQPLQNLSENQLKAQQYLKDHRIEEILGDLINTIAHTQVEQPLVYMIKYLAKQLPSSVLEENGIRVGNDSRQMSATSAQTNSNNSNSSSNNNGGGKNSSNLILREESESLKSIMHIQYPTFEANCNNIFRQALTREAYAACKGILTPFKNDLRHIIALGIENQKHKIGLFATDAACYSTFKPLFGFAQTALFSKATQNLAPIPAIREDFQFHRAFKFSRTTSLNQEFKYIEEFTIKIKRNLAGFPFNSAMTHSQRSQVADILLSTLQNTLPKLFNAHLDLESMEAKDRTNLVVQYNKLIKDGNVFTQAGLRFKDWPDNRKIVLSSNKKYLVWINREDHFELCCSGGGKESNFLDSLIQSALITQLIDEKLGSITNNDPIINNNRSSIGGFSCDRKEGFRCVKPSSTGVATKFKIKVKLPSQLQATFKANVESMKKNTPSPFFEIKAAKKDSSRWIISLSRMHSLNWGDLVHVTEKFVRTLFNTIPDKNQPQLILSQPNLEAFFEPSSLQDHTEIPSVSCSKEELPTSHASPNGKNSEKSNENTQKQPNIIKPQMQQQQQQIPKPQTPPVPSKTTPQTQIQQKAQQSPASSASKYVRKSEKQSKEDSSTQVEQTTTTTTKPSHIEINISELTQTQNEPTTTTAATTQSMNQTSQNQGKKAVNKIIQIDPYLLEIIEQQQRVYDYSDYELPERSSFLAMRLFKKKMYEIQQTQKELINIINSQSDVCVVLQSYSKPKEFVRNAYVILRRNYTHVPLKNHMTQQDFAYVDSMLNQFIASIKTEFRGETFYDHEARKLQKENLPQQFASALVSPGVFEAEMQKLLSEYALIEDDNVFSKLTELDGHKYPYGTLYFKSKYLRVIGNLDDHVTIVLSVCFDDIIESLVHLDRIHFQLSQHIRPHPNRQSESSDSSNTGSYSSDLPFRFHSTFGYLTRNPRMSGSGLSIVYKIKEISGSNPSSNRSNNQNSNALQKNLEISCTDESTQIITKFLNQEMCTQIELNGVEANNLHDFVIECNFRLLQVKKLGDPNKQSLLTENQLSSYDCLDRLNEAVVAPEKECYTFFCDVYEEYLKSSNLKENTLTDNYQADALKFPKISRDINITFEIRRNFDLYNFPKYMGYNEVHQLRMIFSKFTKKYEQFQLKTPDEHNSNTVDHLHQHHLPQSHSDQEYPYASYKSFSYLHINKQLQVDIMKTDHISIASHCKLNDLQDQFIETFEFLHRIQTEAKLRFLHHKTLGNLSEFGQGLGDNFYLKLEMILYSPKEIEDITQLANRYQYEMTMQPSLVEGVAGAGGKQREGTKVTLQLKRCGYFLYETEFIKRVVFTLDEKKVFKQD